MSETRTSLRDYQRQLSARLANQETRQTISKLGVRAGGNSWLVDLADAGEVIPVPAILPVPLMRQWFRGVANVRGKLCSVIDFSAFTGREPIALDQRSRLLLIGEHYRMNAGLLVEAVLGLYREEDFTSGPGAGARWSKADYKDRQGNVWKQLDMDALTSHPEFLHVGI
ncbi:MAG: chemotaxis protein CheW [Methanocella sp.]